MEIPKPFPDEIGVSNPDPIRLADQEGMADVMAPPDQIHDAPDQADRSGRAGVDVAAGEPGLDLGGLRGHSPTETSRKRSGRISSWVEPETSERLKRLADERFGGVQARALDAAIALADIVYSEKGLRSNTKPGEALDLLVRRQLLLAEPSLAETLEYLNAVRHSLVETLDAVSRQLGKVARARSTIEGYQSQSDVNVERP